MFKNLPTREDTWRGYLMYLQPQPRDTYAVEVRLTPLRLVTGNPREPQYCHVASY